MQVKIVERARQLGEDPSKGAGTYDWGCVWVVPGGADHWELTAFAPGCAVFPVLHRVANKFGRIVEESFAIQTWAGVPGVRRHWQMPHQYPSSAYHVHQVHSGWARACTMLCTCLPLQQPYSTAAPGLPVCDVGKHH